MGNTQSNDKVEISKDEYIKYLKYKNSKSKKPILKKQTKYPPINKKVVDQYTHEYHYTEKNSSNKMDDYIYFNNRPQFNPSQNGLLNSIDTRNDDRYNNNLDQALEQQKMERSMNMVTPQAFDSNPYEYQVPFEQTSLNGAQSSLQKPIQHTNEVISLKHKFTEKQQLGMINNQINFSEIDPLGLLKTEKLDLNQLIDKYKSLRNLYSNGDKEIYTKINIALLKLIKIRQYAVKKK
tara:strand:- start:5441 stop:6148 length:708 start_codon:yes stop_codon:yes gene_type:complete